VIGHEVDTGLGARTRQSRVRPLSGELLRAAYDERLVDGGAFVVNTGSLYT
jgi:hypothetical protein